MIELTKSEIETLVNLLQEQAMQLEDDGREGNPDAKLLWHVARQVKASK